MIEQVGTPDTVFHRPATRFVAGFIGSPPMNIVEAEIAADRIVFANGDRLPLRRRFRNASIEGAQNSIRPASGRSSIRQATVCLRRHGERRFTSVRSKSALTEPLGNETLVFVQFRGTRMGVAHAEPDAAGDRSTSIPVSFDLAKAHLFSTPPTGAAIIEGRLTWRRSNGSSGGMVDIPPKVKRTDAIQSFVSQETPIVTITDADGAVGVGYSYTIGTGGSSVMRLIADHLAPRLIGKDAERIEAIWRELEYSTHATTIGAITALALAAIDTALWDLRARKRRGLPLWIVAGGASDRRPLYTTEGGWLHIDETALVEDALQARARGISRLEDQDRPSACVGGLSSARRGALGAWSRLSRS